MLGAFAGLAAVAASTPRESVDAIVAGSLRDAISVAAIIAAFQMTGMSLMLVLIDSPIVQSLRATGHYERLIAFFRSSARTLALFIGIALTVRVLGDCHVRLPAHEKTVPALLAFTFVLAVTSSMRMVRLLVKLLLHKG